MAIAILARTMVAFPPSQRGFAHYFGALFLGELPGLSRAALHAGKMSEGDRRPDFSLALLCALCIIRGSLDDTRG